LRLQGVFVDMATPFDHTGAIFRSKVEFNVAKWNLTTVAGYLVAGSAGEGPLLSAMERTELWRLVKAASTLNSDRPRVLLAGIDSAGVGEATALAAEAAAIGFQAVAALPPRFDARRERDEEVVLLYYRVLADRSPLPVLVRNEPGVTGFDLPVDLIIRLSYHPNIAGLIDGSAGPERTPALAARVRKDFALLGGDEARLWDALQSGAQAAVVTLASAAPYSVIAVWEAYRTREEAAGLDWQDRLRKGAAWLGRRSGVAALKHAMDLNGYYGGPPRLPNPPLPLEARPGVAQAFSDLKG
jgi:4-hydroxy-2-oxoglutarate aldolase